MSSFSRRDLLKTGLLGAIVTPLGGWSRLAYDDEPISFPSISKGDAILLNRNENPYAPSESAKAAMIEAFSKGNRYPNASINDLKLQIAEIEGLTPDHVMITAGSTEMLGLAGLYFGLQKGKLLSCHPTFDFLLRYSERLGAEWVKVPLTKDYKYNLKGLKEALTDDMNMVFVCNPNNPSGTEVDFEDLESFCKEVAPKVPVYLDEAYIEFSDKGKEGSMVHLLEELPNLIIARTFSKVYGLAGIRVGYALAHPDLIKDLGRFHIGAQMSPSAVSVAAASASLKDQDFAQMVLDKTKQVKDVLYSHFEKMGIEYTPSKTSFVQFKTEDRIKGNLRSLLAERNVFIRDYPHSPGWARVSIGTLEEVMSFIKETRSFVNT